jgi:hypothetical protein
MLSCLQILACASKKPNPLQKPERFAEVYAKVLIATEVDGNSNLPHSGEAAVRSARADSILRSLGVDRQQFEAAAKYFGDHPALWKEVYTQVVKILEERTIAEGVDKGDETK